MKFGLVILGCVIFISLSLFYWNDSALEGSTSSEKLKIDSLEELSFNILNEKNNEAASLNVNKEKNTYCYEINCLYPGETTESLSKAYLRGYLGLSISKFKNRFYHETDKDYVMSQAEQGDWDAIEILLHRLHPESFELVHSIAGSNSAMLAEQFSEERELFHEFYIEDIEQRMKAYREIAIVAAAYGRTAALRDLRAPDWSGRTARYSSVLVAIYDGDESVKNYYDEMTKDYTDEQMKALKKDAEALFLDVRKKRAELGISSEEVRSPQYALNYAKNVKHCGKDEDPRSIACLFSRAN